MTPGRDFKPCPFCGSETCDTWCREAAVGLRFEMEGHRCPGCDRWVTRGLRVYLETDQRPLVSCSLSCVLDAAKRTALRGRDAA